MGVHSGKFGVVNGESTVRNWNITDAIENQAYVASNTLFGTGRLPGVESWTGGFSMFGYHPSVLPGGIITFAGYTAPDDDVSGNGMRYDGDALVQQLQISWNWSGGEIISAQVNFNGHLELEAAAGAQLLDLTTPVVPTVIGTKIEYSLADPWDVFTEWTNLVSAQLTLTCAAQSFVNSSTVVDGRLWTGQKPGPLDWTLSVTEHDNRRSIFSKGARVALRAYVSDTEYFLLKWVRVGGYSGLQVDRQTGAIQQQTIEFGMDGFDDDGLYGQVLLPDGVTEWWPGAAAPPTTTA